MLGGWRAGETRDMHVEMNRLMLQITSSLLFGFDNSGLVFELGAMIEHWGGMNHDVGLAALAPQEVEHRDRYEELLARAETLEAKIREMIQLRRGDPHGNDVLSLLLRSQASGDGLTDDELIGQTTLLFSAAHLTSAHSMTWMFYLLAQHPSVGDELSRELAAHWPADPVEVLEPECLPFLDRVLKETLRILPGSAYVQRVNVVPVQLGPFALNRGTVVVFSQFMTHHMRELYPEPERFLPDRWLTIRPSPYAYLPFGAGPRHCLGGPLALVIMKLVVPLVWQRFRMRVQPGARIEANAVSTMLAPMATTPMQLLRPDEPLMRTAVGGNIHQHVHLV
jgi:cytochrome P450